MRSSSLGAIVAATLGLSSGAIADITASTHLGGGQLDTTLFATGWRFTVTDPATVTALGYWDHNGDGLAKSHRVGIFRVSDQTAVITANVVDGTQAPLVDGSRFVQVLPTALQPGTQYYILADTIDGDMYASGVGAIGYGPNVNWLAAANTMLDDIFAPPTYTLGTPGNLAPNFLYSVQAPSPGVISGLALAAAGLAMRRRR